MNNKTEIEIAECDGYKKLLAAVEQDEQKHPNFHDYRGKLNWVIARAKHYGSMTGLGPSDILNSWEARRNYWYMNYYQESNQPEIKGDSVRIFESEDELHRSVGDKGFRCPMCEGISSDPYKCDSGLKMGKTAKTCDWKSYGLFGTLGKGVYVFVKSRMLGNSIFKPIAWD